MGTAGQSITLANSIIGVGILAMPFCFQRCGVLLASVILVFMGLVSRLCCHFLLKSALLARRRNFEFLAFHVFGPAGKLAVEVGIIGFLMGTCIAYFVVVGDLGPQIIAKLLNINQSDILRTSIMVIVSLVCVLPLGLLRNVDSLSNVSAATIGFYFCLVIKVISEAASQFFSSEWQSKMELWKPSGLLQCVPIFSMALFCQTQLFEIFEGLPTLSLEKMNVVTKNAINICTSVYFTLGLFGYIAFATQEISGNILMSLAPTMANDVIKLGFVMSLAFSFPLVIFPCRASLYSFLYKKAHPAHHDNIINHSIPETTFRCITVAIIGVALFISLLIPNIELVLGLVGSTIGVLICVVFPAACFINVTFKNTNERVLAKAVLVLGLVILVLGTFANLQAAEISRYDEKITKERIDKIVEDFFERMEKQPDGKKITNGKPVLTQAEILKKDAAKNSEIQPPNPVPPESNSNEKHQLEIKASDEGKNKQPPAENKLPVADISPDKVLEIHPKNLQTKLNEAKLTNEEKTQNKVVENSKDEKVESPVSQDKTQEKIDIMKQQKLIETIKQHGEEQKELIKEQKEILDELIKTKNELQQNKKQIETVEAKKIAVESIQKIADMAIKSLSGVSEKPQGQKKEAEPEPLEKIANEAVQQIAKKAVEAIEEIKESDKVEKKTDNAVTNVGNVGNGVNAPENNFVNSVPPQNNIHLEQNPRSENLKPQPIVNNFVPINPVFNQNSVQVPVPNMPVPNVPVPNVPQAESLVRNENIAAPQNNIVSAVQSDSANNKIINDVINTNNVPYQPAPVISQNNPVQNKQINQNIQQSPNTQEQQIQTHQQNSQNNDVKLETKQQNINNQQQMMNKQNQNIQQGQISEPVQNVVNNVPQKAHSHTPDEPQSYKQGEDTQKGEMAKNVAQNVPIAIAMNGNTKAKQVQKQNENEVVNKNLNNVQILKENGANVNINNIERNEIHNRQKREVVDCTKTISLEPQDKEICNTLLSNKIEINKIDKVSEEILPLKVDLSDVALNRVPIEMAFHGRSLKSFDDTEKRR